MTVNVEMRYGVNLSVTYTIENRKVKIMGTHVNGVSVKVDKIELMPDLREAISVQREAMMETSFLKRSKQNR